MQSNVANGLSLRNVLVHGDQRVGKGSINNHKRSVDEVKRDMGVFGGQHIGTGSIINISVNNNFRENLKANCACGWTSDPGSCSPGANDNSRCWRVCCLG